MNDNTLKVRIYKDGGTDEISGGNGGQIENTQIAPSETNKKSSIQSSAIATALINAGKQTIMQGVNAFADLSGNHKITDGISVALETASMVGMAFAGPVGWIALSTQLVNKGINYYVEYKKESREINYLKDGLGNIQTYGNRGVY
jgi:hypothetical protein